MELEQASGTIEPASQVAQSPTSASKAPGKRSGTDHFTAFILRFIAFNFNHRQSLHQNIIKDQLGQFVNWTLGFRTENGSVERAIRFQDGKMRVLKAIPAGAETTFVARDDQVMKEMLFAPPDETLNMVRKGKIIIQGNTVLATLFNFYVSLLMGKSHQKKVDKKRAADLKSVAQYDPKDPTIKEELAARRAQRLQADQIDPGVQFLEEPFLSQYSIRDFPRLQQFVDAHFTTKPAICPERAKHLTDWFVANGFETDNDGNPWVPELRQGHAYKYLMEHRQPIIRAGDLLAGTTTSKDIGVVIYPDAIGTIIWGELKSVPNRILNPYSIDDADREVLHHHVFPFWVHRNFKEYVREHYHNPLCQQIDDRFAVMFLWKTTALSHTIPDFPKLMATGTRGIIQEIQEEIANDPSADEQKQATLQAMVLCLEGLTTYAKHLSAQAAADAQHTADPTRKAELERLATICDKVPEHPCETLDEAINATWITWVGLHMENTNAGLSLGRLDQWFQPYFAADLAHITDPADKEAYIKKAIELVGCFYMRCTDHLPLIPDIGNYLFGGSSSDQAVTLGGVTPDGSDAVCDMTYIFLKVTEMLNIRDPNVNARYYPGINSETYLKRLCEVNLITAATPSLHNDVVMLKSLEEFQYDIRDLRNWAATGCVEPTLCGKHIGHTNCMMFSLVAALEMALNNGRHPLMRWDLGPTTGRIEDGAFQTFDDFMDAFTAQLKFLVEQAVEYNNLLGIAHQVLRPTPLLSSLIDGTIQKGRDVTHGGATYNSSGVACIGLADVTDSLMAIKKLVFEEQKITLTELKQAIDANFEGYPAIYGMVRKKVALFGGGNPEAVDMANCVIDLAYDYFGSKQNYRGGPYTVGFWSMSNHVAFGNLAGALPSGRLAGKPFTPGLTPQALASPNLLDNIRDVAQLHMNHITNNMAFNVRVTPGPKDTHADAVNHLFSYVKTYFDLGGMQMQFNVVTSQMLKDAMVHPENYRNLLVRISGYNAYFVTLNRDMQLELIERAEYRL